MVPTLLTFAFVLLVELVLARKVPLSYNLRNLTVRWKTTAMTALAFTLVIALLTVMQAFVNGMQRLTENSGRRDNVLVLSDGAPDEAISNLNVNDLTDIENLRQVERRHNRPAASRETFMIFNESVGSTQGGPAKRQFLQIRGVENAEIAAYVHDLQLLPGGSWFSRAGVRPLAGTGNGGNAAPAVECVMGEGVAHELGRNRSSEELARAPNRSRLDVGDTLQLGNRTWLIVGILDSAVSTFNSEIWAKRSLVGSIFGKDTCTTLVLRGQDVAAAKQLKEFLTPSKDPDDEQAANRVAGSYRKAAVAAQVESDYYESLSQTNKQFSWAIGFVAVVMSVGGVFGVMNTMFAAISQRIKDIGVLRLLGYSRRDILHSFLLESLTIALIGGVLGCALGSLCDGWSATSVVSSGAGAGKTVALKLAVDAPTIARGVLLTLVMGYFGGLLPSVHAMRLRALEALR